jgi:uncharacterized protein (DUF302 family)
MKATLVSHVTYSPSNTFVGFTARLESQLGRHEGAAYETLLQEGLDELEAESAIKAQEGISGLILFAVYDYGALLRLKKVVQKARLYVVGNPLVTARMALFDIRAALYTPLSILVYLDSADRVQVAYDLPSSRVAQLQSADIDRAARELDVTLANVVQGASEDYI